MTATKIDKEQYISKLSEIFESDLVNEIIQFPLVEFPASMRLGTRGTKVEIFPIVMKGSVKSVRYDENGHEILIYLIQPLQSCILSITAAMQGNEVQTCGITNEATTIFAISLEKAAEWLGSYASWRNFVVGLYEKRLNELVHQHDMVTKQKDEIVKQKKDITDSIHYAKRIQNAALPNEDFIKSILPEHFILFQPRDIVSGDYYWLSQIENKTVVAVADCTGHGVPGAFMSMLGISLLNQMVKENRIMHANEILEEMRRSVKKSLRQDEDSENKDGMDMVLMIFDFENLILEYSGAYNPLYIFQDNQFIEIQADRMPIGVYVKDERPFTNHTFQLKKGDAVYAFSDGYVSQSGGETNRKFMSKQFKELLNNIHPKPMSEQKDILVDKLEKWQGNHEQIDDILVMGIRI